jgi:hypothetical protein
MSKPSRNSAAYHRTTPGNAQPASHRKVGLFLAAGGILLVLLALILAFQKPQPPSVSGSPAAGKGPRLAADKSRVDLGDIKLGTTVNVSFTLTNTGSAPLDFSQAPYVEVKQGC